MDQREEIGKARGVTRMLCPAPVIPQEEPACFIPDEQEIGFS
jgi:hypothetical protein